MTELDFLENAEGNLGLSIIGRERKNNIKLEFSNKLNMEVISWKQKTREKWLKDGNKNTRYFHSLANYRRSVNYVEELLIGETSIAGNIEMWEEAYNYFHNMFTEEYSQRPKLRNLNLNRLDDVAAS